MIKRSKTVLLLTKKFACRITFENSVMSNEQLKSLLFKYGGKDCGEYCFIEDDEFFWKLLKEVTKRGGFHDL